MLVKHPHPSPGTTFRIRITLCRRSRQAHCRQTRAKPPPLNRREKRKLVISGHLVAKTHTTKAPDLPRHLSPTKNRSRAPQKQANQTLYSLSQHLKPTRHTLRPLRNGAFRLFRPNSTKRRKYQPLHTKIAMFSDKPTPHNTDKTVNQRPRLTSFLHHTPKPAPERAAFQQKLRRTTQTKPDKPIAAPHKTTPHAKAAPLAVKKRVSNAARNAKITTTSRPNPSFRQEKSDNFNRYSLRFQTVSCKPIIYL